MNQLFLDANILLDFYRFGDDDISEVGKLVALVKDGDIALYMSSHLIAEIERNRDKVLAESFSTLKSTKYGLRVPNYCDSLPECIELKKALRSANEAHSALVAATKMEIDNRSLPADKLIALIVNHAQILTLDDRLLDKAKMRVALGNPPGKTGSMGDAIHWESLLSINYSYRLDLVSRDGDFASELNPNSLKSVLLQEWKRNFSKSSEIELFTSLGAFLRSRFPNIKLSDEATKNELISRLEGSPNFSTTHSIIAEISKFSFFTNGQVKRLFEALVNNSQVGWIGEDSDVNQFYLGLQNKSYVVDDTIQEESARLLKVDRTDFFLPF